MAITCIFHRIFIIFASQTKKQYSMNKVKFQLRSEYFIGRTLEPLHSYTVDFDNLRDLLIFYRVMLLKGFVYEFQFNRFSRSFDGIFNIVYML